MAWDINSVTIIGRLTTDAESKALPSGSSVCNFSIAVGGKPDKLGADTTSFIEITAWGKTAEFCGQYLKKGNRVAVTGRLEQQHWQDNAGAKRSKVVIIADRIQSLTMPVKQPDQTEEGFYLPMNEDTGF